MICFLSVLNSRKMLTLTLRMKPIFLLLLGFLLGPLVVQAVDLPKGFDTNGVDFFLPQAATAGRASLDDLATYTRKLQDVCETFFANTTTPDDLDIVAAVKPGPQSRIWLISQAPPPADVRLAALRQKLAAVEPPPVHDGPIALSIHGLIAGGNDQPPTQPSRPPQMPDDWKAVLLKNRTAKPVAFDDMIAIVWNGPPHTSSVNIPNLIGITLLVIIGIVFAVRYRRNNS
jgi:hypothetical protein